MGLVETLTAEITAATLDDDQFGQFTFPILYQKAALQADYDPVTGISTNSNTAQPARMITPAASIVESDGESIKETTLQGFIIKAWLPGIKLQIDDRITVVGGGFAGIWLIETIPDITEVHYELSLKALS